MHGYDLLEWVNAVMCSQSGFQTVFLKILKTLQHAAIEMEHDNFCGFWPNMWLNDEVVNASVALLDVNTPDHVFLKLLYYSVACWQLS